MTTFAPSTRRSVVPAPLHRQLASAGVVLVWVYGVAVLALLVPIAVRLRWGIPTEIFMRDVATLTNVPPYTGLFSSLGILMWTAAATLCLFLAACRSGVGQTPRAFWTYAGILTAALLADDLFLLHEVVFPYHLGVPEPLVYVAYGVLAVGFLVAFRRVILRTEFVLLALALAWFAASLTVDRWGHLWLPRGFFLVEDGFKLLGIASWLLYFARTAFAELRFEVAAHWRR